MKHDSDFDPVETREWVESLQAVVAAHGKDRARQIMESVLAEAMRRGAGPAGPLVTDYLNTLPADEEPDYPGDPELEERIENILRWNAAAMVSRANTRSDGLGGHLSTYASSATLYEVGFNHFFRGKGGKGPGDQIFYQGHGAPGIYARSYLEGRFTASQLDLFRRESDRISRAGLSSYPHPRLMPDYWEFPTVSMGLGPLAAIYQARFNRYLHARGFEEAAGSRVWAFLGDGETDEPESGGALTLAAREGLDNLVFVINCNLQRLDGPVRGNGRIVQELEGLYRGAGWNVIKVLWGREWDPLIAKDDGELVRTWNGIPDGEWQHFADGSGALLRERLFGRSEGLARLAEGMSDEDLGRLRSGGHDRRRVHAAYRAAVQASGRPTVILAQTVKGFKLGKGFAGKNSTHQMKTLSEDQVKDLRDSLGIPLEDGALAGFPYYHPGKDSAEVRYLNERRAALDGTLPLRKVRISLPARLPDDSIFAHFHKGSKGAASTTMVLAQMLARLLKDDNIGKLLVPIIPDEARTFGMDPLFRQVGIYSPRGQTYEPVDSKSLLFYRESEDGQVLQEGITEAGAMASFTAAGTAYATHGVQTIPFFCFYSMFGFQRIGDQAWAFGDARGRGFLMGGTSGRTTLNGEGLQHEDGQSHILCAAIPNLKAYDPAFAYELAVIVREGLRRMVDENEDIFYYVTIHNQNDVQPPMPPGVEEGVLAGLYTFREAPGDSKLRVHLWGSGAIMVEVLKAADLLASEYGVAATVWSATSYRELRDDALRAERRSRMNPGATPEPCYLDRVLPPAEEPIVAASDYVKLLPEMVARFIPNIFIPLGTDGFGMSDTREALRSHFEVDSKSIAYAALCALAEEGVFDRKKLASALTDLGLNREKVDPLDV